MKRIGLIRMRYTPYGGAEVFLSRLVDGLIKRGHECHVFANVWKKDKRDGLVFHKVGVIRWPSFLRVLSFAISTYFVLRKTQMDVIIGFDRTFHQDIYRAGDGCHREWLIQRQGSGVRSKILLPLKRLITYINPLHLTILYLEKKLFQSKRLKFVIANSQRGKQEIIRHYGLPEEKVHVIYNGIDLKGFCLKEEERLREEYRQGLGISPDEVLLLFVGSGFERKGLKFLIEAMAIIQGSGVRDQGSGRYGPVLKRRNLRLLVVGKGNYRTYLRLARRFGVGMDVIFKGPVKDVKGYYYASDIFVLPSIYEPFSNACLEAMAGGLPVVTSRANGVSEILADGEDGMIIDDPTNPGEITERIVPLLERHKRLEMGRAARNKAEGYSIERNVDEFLRLIDIYNV